ncbi:MAG TPA: peptidoglycan-binding protein, partial [Vicinamibacteria bacterium]|nr:peptidoglycan-binding protein [Vicinamibacteria bacterium]
MVLCTLPNRRVFALAALAALWSGPAPAGDAIPGVAEEIELRLASPVLPSWAPAGFRSDGQWNALQRFYKERAYAPAWIADAGLDPRATEFVEALARLADHGLDPRQYAPSPAVPAAGTEAGHAWPTALANRDLQISLSLLRVAQDVLEGRFSPRGASAYWPAAPAVEADGAELLRRAVEGEGPAALLSGLAPAHAQYAALLQALAEHRAIAAAGGWPPVPEMEPRRGRQDPRLPFLRARLAASGDLPAAAQTARPSAFDRALQQALKRFQARHGLTADGKLGGATLAALNVPVEERIEQIELNLERWRWLPRQLGERYVLVNVGAFELHAVENGRVAERMKIVA